MLLFVGTVCNAMIAPFMGFFIVEGLKQPPWTISIYAGALSCLAIAINRQFARRIDRGESASALIGIALGGYLLANLALSTVPSLWATLTFGVVGFGVSTSAVSTMFSLGAALAEQQQIERNRLNAFMRATTSTAWMVGPAVSFLIADQIGKIAVFRFCRYAPGTAFTVKTFVEVLAIFSTPLLIARFGIRKPLMATALLAVVAIQVLASVQTFPQMLVGAAMEGLYYGLYASLGISFVQSYAGSGPARATAIYWNTLMISGILAGPAVGLIAQAYGFRTVLQVASSVAFLAAVVLLLGARQSRILTSSPP